MINPKTMQEEISMQELIAKYVDEHCLFLHNSRGGIYLGEWELEEDGDKVFIQYRLREG